MTEQTANERGRWRISLRFSVIAILVGSVALAGAAIHLPWLYVSRINTELMARQLNAEIASGVDREVAAIFDSAVAAQEALRETLSERVVDFKDDEARDKLFFAILKAHPHFSWVSLGLPNGDFFGAQRRDDVNLRIARSVWNPPRQLADRVETYYVDDGVRISRTITKRESNDYFAPDREWFRAAIAAPDQHVWTDIYVFSASRRPGLNAAVTLRDSDTGAIVGVVSVAIELERISRYLGGLSSVRSGAAFIIDGEGRLLAHPDPTRVTRLQPGADAPELVRLGESDEPMLRLAAASIASEGVSLADIAEAGQFGVTDAAGARYILSLAPAARKGWLIGTLIPESDFTAAIDENYLRLAAAVAAALLLVVALALFITRRVLIRPLYALMEETQKIARFDLDQVRHVDSPLIEVDALSRSIGTMTRGLGSFRRYIPTDLVRSLLDRGVEAELGGERRMMTMLFMDLEGFTNISERLGHRVVPLLADYFGAMSGAIQSNSGVIDKYIGDGIMAFWGAPKHNEDHPLLACRAALACQREMDRLRSEWTSRGLPAPRLRIGLNSGRVVVGNIGSDDRLNYTVIGDPVNLAARLEGMNREYGTGILISQTTRDLVKYDMLARRIDTVRVKGKEEPVAIYELLAARDDSGRVEGFDWVERFESGVSLMEARRWAEAAAEFRKVIEAKGEDAPSRVFIARAEAAAAGEPPKSRMRAVDPAE